MANCDSFILNKPDVTPAFHAVNQGYDVWLGNSRGNNNSTKHVKLDMKKDPKKYWDFGW
jgi:lysosomal acid lipase/cholesteryl ester hydrolase